MWLLTYPWLLWGEARGPPSCLSYGGADWRLIPCVALSLWAFKWSVQPTACQALMPIFAQVELAAAFFLLQQAILGMWAHWQHARSCPCWDFWEMLAWYRNQHCRHQWEMLNPHWDVCHWVPGWGRHATGLKAAQHPHAHTSMNSSSRICCMTM